MSATNTHDVDRHRAALLVVDLQNDFLPGGALAVPHGDDILGPLSALLDSGLFGFVVATQDWHPPRHVSFASSHPGRKPFEVIEVHGRPQTLWPDHCVAGTHGADLTRALSFVPARAIVRKGTATHVDSYSAFRNNFGPDGERAPTGLGGYLQECGIRDVYVCGLARDFCVSWTAQDAAHLGFSTTVIWDLSRAVDPANETDVERGLRARGVSIVDSAALR